MNKYLISSLMIYLSACTTMMPDKTKDKPASTEGIIDHYCYQYRYGNYAYAENHPRAFEWCKKGAHLGLANSQVLLAEMYFFGLSRKKTTKRPYIGI